MAWWSRRPKPQGRHAAGSVARDVVPVMARGARDEAATAPPTSGSPRVDRPGPAAVVEVPRARPRPLVQEADAQAFAAVVLGPRLALDVLPQLDDAPVPLPTGGPVEAARPTRPAAPVAALGEEPDVTTSIALLLATGQAFDADPYVSAETSAALPPSATSAPAAPAPPVVPAPLGPPSQPPAPAVQSPATPAAPAPGVGPHPVAVPAPRPTALPASSAQPNSTARVHRDPSEPAAAASPPWAGGALAQGWTAVLQPPPPHVPAPRAVAPADPAEPRTALVAQQAPSLAGQPPVRPPAEPAAEQAASGPPAHVPEQTRRHVELGFRDGTTTALDPDSEQAVALAELTALLTGRG